MPLQPVMLAAISPVDAGVLLLYLGALLAVGLYFSSRQKTATEFLLAGRSLGWFPLGASLAAALAGAAITDLPAQAYERGLACWVIPAAQWLLLPLVVYLLAPVFRGLSLDSLYQYLEYRFDARVRLAAVLIFLACRWLWLMAVITLPCRSLALASGNLPAWAVILPLGIVATLYTFLGGLRAVAWSGAAHVGLMLLGLAVVIGGAWWNLDGEAARVAVVARSLGRLSAGDLTFDWSNDSSIWAILPYWLCAGLALAASDQSAGQRFLAAKNVNVARTSYLASTLALSLLFLGMIYAGLCLLTFYQTHPVALRPQWVVNIDGQTRTAIAQQGGRHLLDPLDPTQAVTWENIHQLVAERRILRPNDKLPFTTADGLIDPATNRVLVEKLAMRKPNEGTLGGEYVVSRDAPREMLPYFVATQLPWGLSGLAAAAMAAGALAAIDASLSALVATLIFDLHRRYGLGRRWLAGRLGKEASALDAADELQLARPLTLVLGTAATIGAIAVAQFPAAGALLLACTAALAAPLLGLFLLGLLTRRATAAAALAATIGGLIFALGLRSQTPRIAESWMLVAGTLGTFLLGYVLSFVLGRAKTRLELRGLVAGCGTLGTRSVDEVAPLISVPGNSAEPSGANGIRWK